MPEAIVAGYDGSEEGRASVELARQVAIASGAPLHVVVAAMDPLADVVATRAGLDLAAWRTELVEETERSARAALSDFLEPEPSRITLVVRIGRPEYVLSEYATETDAALVVVGGPTRGKRRFRTARGTAGHLLRRHSIPVLVAAPTTVKIERVLAALESTVAGRPVIQHARRLARALGARVEYLHVIDRHAIEAARRRGPRWSDPAGVLTARAETEIWPLLERGESPSHRDGTCGRDDRAYRRRRRSHAAGGGFAWQGLDRARAARQHDRGAAGESARRHAGRADPAVRRGIIACRLEERTRTMNNLDDVHEENPASRHEPTSLRPLVQHYLRDLIYGANDGMITTFAVVAGVAGASLESRVVLILGFANLLGDGFSMGASNFLAIRSDEAARLSAGRPSLEPFPARHAVATFAAFVIAGMLPLISYIFVHGVDPFFLAVALTMTAQFLLGAARSLVTELPWWRAGAEMLAVGTVAAAVAFGVGAAARRIIG
jgi:VIT1/CCC1 family predicted Fe2+/Mn2+ transporter/nucleotide-binding universal stress UspA family protein